MLSLCENIVHSFIVVYTLFMICTVYMNNVLYELVNCDLPVLFGVAASQINCTVKC